MPERAASLVEAHSYAGGLRHTPFSRNGRRPDWVPPADSVGWRDEFELDSNDTVIEFSQRKHNDDEVTWLAVYKRSIDARFGDRNNHAGIGVWLSRVRIADARALLVSLDRFAGALASNPDPSLLTDKIAEFASERFLQSYLVLADQLPRDWRGVTAAGSALVDTSLFAVVAPNFDAALPSIVETITRWSLGWDNSGATPRALVRVTNDPTALSRPGFAQLPPSGTFLADIIERIPHSFEAAREAVRAAEAKCSNDTARLEGEVRTLKERWDQERRDSELLDGLPVTMEGIAKRLNTIARQNSELRAQISSLSRPKQPERPQTVNPSPPLGHVNLGSPDREYHPKPTRMPRSSTSSYNFGDDYSYSTTLYIMFGLMALVVLGVIGFALYRFYA